jgi:hypothetical protein
MSVETAPVKSIRKAYPFGIEIAFDSDSSTLQNLSIFPVKGSAPKHLPVTRGVFRCLATLSKMPYTTPVQTLLLEALSVC